jgi:hypothetical protein
MTITRKLNSFPLISTHISTCLCKYNKNTTITKKNKKASASALKEIITQFYTLMPTANLEDVSIPFTFSY